MRAGEAAPIVGIHDQRGFTLVVLLATLVTMSVGLSIAGPRWAEKVRRDREAELIKIGVLYAQALADFRRASPGSLKHYPQRLSDLLEDKRFVGTRRHLRELYPDPINPSMPWGLILGSDGGIRGIYSQSSAAPALQSRLDLGLLVLPPAQRYSDWHFAPKETP